MNRSASTSSSLSREPKAEARVASLQDGARWRPAIGLGLATLLLAGAVYAGIATGFAGLAYPTQAEGSLLRDGSGQVRGSAWLAQPFIGDGYFQHGRRRPTTTRWRQPVPTWRAATRRWPSASPPAPLRWPRAKASPRRRYRRTW